MLGELSKYQRLTVTPSASTRITATHNLGIIPKIIIVSIDTSLGSSSVLLENGIFGVINGAMCLGDQTTNRAFRNQGSSSVGNGSYYMDDSYFDIYRSSATNAWSTTNSYTVELYA